jgi:nucleoside-diphosphate-sugar epimerase
MRILLTGHEGYVGSVMTSFLLEAGHYVVGLDTRLFGGCDFGEYKSPIPRLRCDLRDATAWELEGFEAVIHLAAISNDPLGNLNPQCTYDINHLASISLAKAAREAGVERFVYSSSCSVYGAASPDDVLDEKASFSPVTPYAESKVLVERDLPALATDDFSPTYMRNATVYGVSPRLRGDLVVNNLSGWAFCTGRVLLKSDGTPWRPLLHVQDMCAAFLAVIEAPRERVANEAFNVGAQGENYRMSDVATLVEKTIPGSRIDFAEDAGPDPRCYRVDFSKIERMLPEFKPRWNVERGVEELRDAYEKVGLTTEDLEGDRFLRIRHIQEMLESGRLDPDLRWTTKDA